VSGWFSLGSRRRARLSAASGEVTRPATGGRGSARPPVIALRRIVKAYQMGDVVVEALRGVSITIERGEFVAIMGASGSGKSTLMNIIGCLDVPTRGWFFLDGIDVRQLDESALSTVRSRKIGFIFQSFNLLPRTSALAQVELPMLYAGVKTAERRERASAALEAVGLGNRLSHLPNEMSGGQQQRVAIARAISTNPALLLADEPTGNLDSAATAEIMDIFRRLHQEGRTIVLITHEEEVASSAQRVIRLRDGKVLDDYLQTPRSARDQSSSPDSDEQGATPSRGIAASEVLAR